MLRHFLRVFDSTIFIFVAIFSLALTIALQAGFLGIVLGFTALSWIFKYCYVLLEEIAHGAEQPPVLSAEMVNPVGEQRPWLQALIVIGVFTGLHSIGGLLSRILGAAALLLLPASIAVLGVSGASGVFQALNPIALTRIALRLGAGYVLVLAIVVIWTVLLLALAKYLPLIILIALGQIALLMLFCMLGVVIYERRLELGLQPLRSPEITAAREQREQARERQQVIDELYRYVRVRNYQDFVKALAGRLAAITENRGSEAHAIAERVLAFADPVASTITARRLCAWLVRYGEADQGVEVYERMRPKTEDFDFDKPKDGLALLEAARDIGKRDVALQILEDLERDTAAAVHTEVLARWRRQLMP